MLLVLDLSLLALLRASFVGFALNVIDPDFIGWIPRVVLLDVTSDTRGAVDQPPYAVAVVDVPVPLGSTLLGDSWC